MHYLGSKARHADEILHHVLAARKPGQVYVEPFVGGANVLCRVPADMGPRIAADLNEYMVALHKALAAGWVPPVLVTEADYKKMKRKPQDFPQELIGFVATGCSFGSMWFSAFAKDDADKPKGTRCRQASEACMRDAPGLKDVQFFHSTFDTLKDKVEIPADALWYCDPPYANTTGYEGAAQVIKVGDAGDKNRWKPAKFWRWADALVDAGATVFVSEYTRPNGPDIYKAPASDALKSLRARHGELQRDENSTSVQLDESLQAIQAEEAKGTDYCHAQAARWEVVWEKAVNVNIAGGAVEEARAKAREEAEAAGLSEADIETAVAAVTPKKETEKLFTRRL